MDSSILWIFGMLIFSLVFLIPGFLALRANRGMFHIRKNVTYQPDEQSFWVGLGCFSYLIFGIGLLSMGIGLIALALKILDALGMLG